MPSSSLLRLTPLIAGLAGATGLILLGLGLWQALIVSPPDAEQGEFVRLMYVHVPAAWLGMGYYGLMALLSAAYVIWKAPLADLAARELAPIGAAITLLCLITGMLWGKPMWGTWWVWDARLTSMLLLFFLYIGYMMLARTVERPEQAAMPLAILAIIGAINLPIIKFSVEWWNTLHQPATVFRSGGSSLDDSMKTPLLLMTFSFFLLSFSAWAMGVASSLMERKLQREKFKSASRPNTPASAAQSTET